MKTLKNFSRRSSTWFHQSHHCPHSPACSLLSPCWRDVMKFLPLPAADMSIRLCFLLQEGRCLPPANMALISPHRTFSVNKVLHLVLWFDLIMTSVVGEAKNHNKEYSNLHSDKKQNELVSTVKAKLRIHYRRKNDQWNWPGRPSGQCQPLTPLRGGQCPPGGEE